MKRLVVLGLLIFLVGSTSFSQPVLSAATDGSRRSGEAAAANVNPSIQITWPLNGATNVPRTGTINVNASDPDGYVYRVDYYLVNPQTFLASTSIQPFTLAYANAPPGWYTLVAVAYDNEYAYTISNSVTVYIP
jgi:Bacterial Ig domain